MINFNKLNKKDFFKTMFKTVVSFVMSFAMIFSSFSAVFAADSDRTVHLEIFNPDGIMVLTKTVPMYTKFKDVPELGSYIVGNHKDYPNQTYEGVFDRFTGHKINPDDAVKADCYLIQKYHAKPFTITAHENGKTEYFHYYLSESHGIPTYKIPSPKYVPSGYKFTGWTGNGVNLKNRTIRGKSVYFIPYAIDRDFSITANYIKLSNTSKAKSYDLKKMKIYGISDKTYTGKNITFKPYTYIKSKKTYLSLKYSDRKNIGKHFVTVSGKYPVTGSVKKNFAIKPAKPSFKIVGKKAWNITVKVSGLKGGAKAQIAVKKGSGKWYYYKTGSSKDFKLSQGSYNIKVRAYKGSLYSSYTGTRGYGWRKMKRMDKCR